MPSTSKKQHNFMEAVAHNPSFAKKAGVPQSVGKDFSNADKGKTFKQGGNMVTKITKSNNMANKPASARTSNSTPALTSTRTMNSMPAFERSSASRVNVGMGAKVSPKPEQATANMKKGGMAGTKKYASGGSVASTVTVNAGKKQSMNYDIKPGKSVPASAALPRKMAKVATNPGNINGVAKYGKTKGKNYGNDGPKMPSKTRS
jgi:hypothetical protein